jgi:DNA uptake protein ComE-like DNA-binding protein
MVLAKEQLTKAMARQHWLDPLARKLLQAIGDLPPDPQTQPKAKIREQPQSAPSWSLDVNRATTEQWKKLPGCNEDMIDVLMRLQRGGVQFTHMNDLSSLLDLPSDLLELWEPHLLFRWHGDSPVLPEQPLLDLNAAAPLLLKQSLHWPERRLQGLIQERRRQPFEHLADLQERLCLPPDVIENLIGRVSFGIRPSGPSLPPRS